MTATLPVLLVPLGILSSQEVLRSAPFQFLAAFVAVNTLMYVTLAVAKILPKVYLSDWTPGRSRRTETRSIHPEDPGERLAPAPQARSHERIPATEGLKAS